MFRPLVPDPELNQQGSRGGLEVKAALQHCRLRAGGFGWEVNNHQTLKLLQKLLWHGVARSLGLLPRHLEPVKSLVHLHHLLVESAQVRGHTHTTILFIADEWHVRKRQHGTFLGDLWDRNFIFVDVVLPLVGEYLWKPRCRVSCVRMRFSVRRL